MERAVGPLTVAGMERRNRELDRMISRRIVWWRATVDEDGHYMMRRPRARFNRLICDALRSYATLHGRLHPDFVGWSGYPSIAAPVGRSRDRRMCQQET